MPGKFKSWGEAGKAVIGARVANKTPSEVDEDTWIAFETMAYSLIPKFNRYVVKSGGGVNRFFDINDI